MKECKCPLCKGQRCFLFASNVYFLEGNFYSFYKCKICDVIFTHPLPSELLIKNLYNTTYFEKDYNFGFLEGDYFSSFESREKEFFWITENIKRYFMRR